MVVGEGLFVASLLTLRAVACGNVLSLTLKSNLYRRFSPFPADVLTNFTCQFAVSLQRMMVVGEGFEPSKSMTADLQSAPFGHSGTPPLACFRLGKRGASYQMKRPCKGMNNGK
jgi:hypothetical protein